MESPEAKPEPHPDRPLTDTERLTATRSRARAQLSQEEAARMRGLLAKELREWDVEFEDLTRSYHRMLYVAAVMDEPLSVAEMRYLLIARWKSNTDEASLRKRLALGVQQNELKWRRGDRYALTPDGVNHLAQIAGRIRERKEGGPRKPPRDERSRWGGGRDYPDRRGGGGPPRADRDRGPRRNYSR